MKLERYEFELETKRNMYIFFSQGPKGKIKKAVSFHKFFSSSELIYTLVMGDWDDNTDDIDHLVITNNGDRQKVLATVVAILVQFMEKNLNYIVIATGSTLSPDTFVPDGNRFIYR